jgi:hypothetical protein
MPGGEGPVTDPVCTDVLRYLPGAVYFFGSTFVPQVLRPNGR